MNFPMEAAEAARKVAKAPQPAHRKLRRVTGCVRGATGGGAGGGVADGGFIGLSASSADTGFEG